MTVETKKIQILNTAPLFDAVVKMPIPDLDAMLGIRMRENQLIGIDFLWEKPSCLAGSNNAVIPVVEQLTAYFNNPSYLFSLAIDYPGTTFQTRVWDALRRLPAGETCSYGTLANRLGSGAQAVGGACKRNPVPVVVPCHRIVSKTGPGGFSGKTKGRMLAVKKWLLQHERGVKVATEPLVLHQQSTIT